MVGEAIDGRSRGHGIFEDLLPLRERKVASQHHAAALMAFGQQGEDLINLGAALLNVADIVIASIVLSMWRSGEVYDPAVLNQTA